MKKLFICFLFLIVYLSSSSQSTSLSFSIEDLNKLRTKDFSDLNDKLLENNWKFYRSNKPGNGDYGNVFWGLQNSNYRAPDELILWYYDSDNRPDYNIIIYTIRGDDNYLRFKRIANNALEKIGSEVTGQGFKDTYVGKSNGLFNTMIEIEFKKRKLYESYGL